MKRERSEESEVEIKTEFLDESNAPRVSRPIVQFVPRSMCYAVPRRVKREETEEREEDMEDMKGKEFSGITIKQEEEEPGPVTDADFRPLHSASNPYLEDFSLSYCFQIQNRADLEQLSLPELRLKLQAVPALWKYSTCTNMRSMIGLFLEWQKKALARRDAMARSWRC